MVSAALFAGPLVPVLRRHQRVKQKHPPTAVASEAPELSAFGNRDAAPDVRVVANSFLPHFENEAGFCTNELDAGFPARLAVIPACGARGPANFARSRSAPWCFDGLHPQLVVTVPINALPIGLVHVLIAARLVSSHLRMRRTINCPACAIGLFFRVLIVRVIDRTDPSSSTFASHVARRPRVRCFANARARTEVSFRVFCRACRTR